MKKQLCKIVSLIIGIITILGSVFTFPSQAAENDFSMKAFDKAYVSFLFDDQRMPFTKECFELFQEFNMPMCCNVVAERVNELDLLLKIQDAGGEILSHTYSHNALTENTCSIENIEKELGDSYRVLTAMGFNINGIIETGNGGREATANYELIETISRKYYKYSNAYGVSPQYKLNRIWLKDKSVSNVKSLISTAINNKEWVSFWIHDFSEFSKENMREILEYIQGKGKNKVEVVTWNYVYNNFAEYTGPQVPTVEAIQSVCDTQGHDLKNATVEKAATCENGPVMNGECKRCGKKGSFPSKSGALGHKFENYVDDNNADCSNRATKTAKCSNKGCTATDTIIDHKSNFKHDFKTVTIRKSTTVTEGLAEIKCSICEYCKETVVIPKGKKAEDVISLTPEENATSSTTGSSFQEEQNTNGIAEDGAFLEGQDTSDKSTNKSKLAIILIVVLSLVLVAMGVFVFFIIKKLKS